jgi:hypothetical protein
MPIISICFYDNYSESYFIILWHPDFRERDLRKSTNYKIKSKVFKDREVILKDVVVIEVTSEKEVLKEFFKLFSNLKFNNL